MNPHWLLRASRWARNPPPLKRVLVVLAIVAGCLLLAGAEWVFDWDIGSQPQRNRIVTTP
ncbi:hypothetical protein EU805_06720 [Salipiger sp. IMCC34102]|uniref:hypothetical protein n=1 Tax=Salipiger sp. IMCC34102 TaxID=2510647 RepID=UPI00101C8E4B|nr:hypothetical protein [Salipiger sp. IMCC34102]RYH03407.1 hypothetical protein EU805_06720 [Salipiger sp. IMCC34102]